MLLSACDFLCSLGMPHPAAFLFIFEVGRHPLPEVLSEAAAFVLLFFRLVLFISNT